MRNDCLSFFDCGHFFLFRSANLLSYGLRLVREGDRNGFRKVTARGTIAVFISYPIDDVSNTIGANVLVGPTHDQNLMFLNLVATLIFYLDGLHGANDFLFDIIVCLIAVVEGAILYRCVEGVASDANGSFGLLSAVGTFVIWRPLGGLTDSRFGH